jgi:hypothetical protein
MLYILGTLLLYKNTNTLLLSKYTVNRSDVKKNGISLFRIIPLRRNVWETLPLFLFSHIRFCSDGISDGRVSVRMTSQASRGFMLHYRCSYERNFIMRIFLKRSLSVRVKECHLFNDNFAQNGK